MRCGMDLRGEILCLYDVRKRILWERTRELVRWRIQLRRRGFDGGRGRGMKVVSEAVVAPGIPCLRMRTNWWFGWLGNLLWRNSELGVGKPDSHGILLA